jgi:D-alanyl-D-alanine carboxypeptidase
VNRRTNWLNALVGVLLAATIALGVAYPVPAQTKKAAATATPIPTATPAPGAYNAAHPENLKVSNILGEAAVVMDASSGRVLFEKNADEKLYPASTTKTMTLLLALEHGRLDDVVTVSAEAGKIPKDSSLVPVTVGEQLTLRDLLYGMIMRSGNDAAVAVAVYIAGSVDKFADMMNQKAKDLGCTNTHFVNPHGYQDQDHYTTARDLALIAREGMKNDTFRQIVSTRSYQMAATNKHKARTIQSTDSMLNPESANYYQYEIGVKSGYHSLAGQCFVGAAQKDGTTLVSVTLKSTKVGKWTDTKRLMEYGFTRYQRYAFQELYAASPLYADVRDAEAGDESLELALVPGGTIDGYGIRCVPEDLEADAKTVMGRAQVQYTRALTAPVHAGDVLGTVTITTNDGTQLSGTVAASRDVAAVQPTPTPTPEPTPTPAPTTEPTPALVAASAASPAPTQRDIAAAAIVQGTPAPRQGVLAPWTGSPDLMLLMGLAGLFVLVLLTIAGFRIHFALRRRRYRKMSRKRRSAGSR